MVQNLLPASEEVLFASDITEVKFSAQDVVVHCAFFFFNVMFKNVKAFC